MAPQTANSKLPTVFSVLCLLSAVLCQPPNATGSWLIDGQSAQTLEVQSISAFADARYEPLATPIALMVLTVPYGLFPNLAIEQADTNGAVTWSSTLATDESYVISGLTGGNAAYNGVYHRYSLWWDPNDSFENGKPKYQLTDDDSVSLVSDAGGSKLYKNETILIAETAVVHPNRWPATTGWNNGLVLTWSKNFDPDAEWYYRTSIGGEWIPWINSRTPDMASRTELLKAHYFKCVPSTIDSTSDLTGFYAMPADGSYWKNSRMRGDPGGSYRLEVQIEKER